MSNILLAVLAYNIIVIGGIGWYLSWKQKKNNTVIDMALGGRSAGLLMTAITLAITYKGSAHVYGLMELSFSMGSVALWFGFAHTVLFCVICFGTGRWIRRVNCSTIPELIGKLYNKQLRKLTASVAAMVVFGLVTLETQALGIGISAMSNWGLGWSAVVGAIIGTAYVSIGGMKQTMTVNLINAAVMYSAIIIAGIYLAYCLPHGWGGVVDYYTSHDEGFKLSILGNPDMLAGFALAAVFAVVFSQSVNQQGMQACMSAKDEHVIRKSIWITAPLNGLFGVFPVLCGVAAASIPEFSHLGAKMAGATLVVTLLPTWIAVLVQAGFIGSLLSTFAMSALAPATIFAKDIIGSQEFAKTNPAAEKRLIQWTIIGIGALAGILTFFQRPNVILSITWLFAWVVPFFFIIVVGLFWKRSNTAATTTIVLSWLVNVLWSFTNIKDVLHLGMLENAHVVAIVACLSTVLVNLLITKAEPALFSKKYEFEHQDERVIS